MLFTDNTIQVRLLLSMGHVLLSLILFCMLFLYIAIWYDFIPDVIKYLCYTMAYKKKTGNSWPTCFFTAQTNKKQAGYKAFLMVYAVSIRVRVRSVGQFVALPAASFILPCPCFSVWICCTCSNNACHRDLSVSGMWITKDRPHRPPSQNIC